MKEDLTVAVKYVNKLKLIKYTGRGKNPLDLRFQAEALLAPVKEGWLSGKITRQAAMKQVQDHLSTLDEGTTVDLMRDLITICFTPQMLADVLRPSEKVLRSISKRKSPNDTWVLAGNFDRDTWSQIVTKRSDLLKVFDHTFLSFHAECCTPDDMFFEKLFLTIGMHPLKTVFYGDFKGTLAERYGSKVFEIEQI